MSILGDEDKKKNNIKLNKKEINNYKYLNFDYGSKHKNNL
jgi:hypothetical protein